MKNTTTIGLLVLSVMLLCMTVSSADAKVSSPLKQFNQGVPINEIRCNDGKILLESSKVKPICVSRDTSGKLLDRGYVAVIQNNIVENNITKGTMSSGDHTTTEQNQTSVISNPVDSFTIEINEELAVSENHLVEKSNKNNIDTSSNTLPLIQIVTKTNNSINKKSFANIPNLEIINKLAYKPPQEPVLSIPPVTYPPGSKVSIGGFGFNPNQMATITVFDSSEKKIITKTIITQHDSYFKKKITLPNNAEYGTWIVKFQEGGNNLESTFAVGDRYMPQPVKRTVDETFDSSQCQNTLDPLIIYKCWDQDTIAKNINCYGFNYTKPQCHPPDSAYREPPQFDKLSYVDEIPSDVTFDYHIKIPPDNIDVFANNMIGFLDDKILEKRIQRYNDTRYETEKGWMHFDSNKSPRGSSFTYTIEGVGRIHPDEGKQFTADLLDELGIILDGTEFYRQGLADTSNYSHKFWQNKDGIKVTSNSVSTIIKPGYTVITVNNWNTNLSEMNLYDVKESIKNGQEFALGNKELNGIDCQLEMRDGFDGVTLVIFEGRPLYEMYGGSCMVRYMDGHNGWYSVFVDALTGDPLFIESRTLF